MAAISDKFSGTFNSVNPNVAKVTSARTAGGTTLACDNLAGWSTDLKVNFSTYKIGTDGVSIIGQIDWQGIVSGNTVGSLTRIAGATDTGNAVNDWVEMNPTAKWADELARGILVAHNPDGALKDSVVISSKIADNAVTATKLDTGAITLGYAEASTSQSIASTAYTDLTGLTTTVTVPAGGRRIKITGYMPDVASGAAANGVELHIYEGGTSLNYTRRNIELNKSSGTLVAMYSSVLSAGSHTFKLVVKDDAANGVDYKMFSNSKGFILVEAI